MKHEAVRVDNLMYKGCEPHWKCIYCGECVPFHCYNKQQFEERNCKEIITETEIADKAEDNNAKQF